ncbi:MAG: protein adenylyltransferase SelO [Rubricella sp.]
MPAIAFDNTYAQLPERFHVRMAAEPVSSPALIAVNADLARVMGIEPEWLGSPEGLAWLSGNAVPEGAEPLAMAYAGHQFGNFVPQLGDGRALLIGEVVGRDGVRRDIQLKGSGRTPFSRMGDGRAALGPVLREYIVSEAMHALGVPTTRALAAVTTGDPVLREAGPLPGGVLARVGQSHVRVGTFEYFYARRDAEGLALLADYVIERHYPALRGDDDRYAKLIEAVAARQAALVAQWMRLGFIHGVMNTDNCQIAGETIDYGPCAFMEAFDPGKVFSSIDHAGRYAWGNQGRIAHWNVSRLAQALLPILGEGEAAVERAQAAVDTFPDAFSKAHVEGFSRKLGLAEPDPEFVNETLEMLAEAAPDWTLFWAALTEEATGGEVDPAALLGGADAERWLNAWRARSPDPAPMRAENPIYIPRNHRVEEAIAAGVDGDFEPFERLLSVVTRPFDPQPESAAYRAPASAEEEVRVTFCGT